MLFRRHEIRPVRTIGDPVLAAVAHPVLTVDASIRELAAEMLLAMRAFDGIGIAAPQVGESLRLVVFEVPPPESPADLTPGEALLLPRMPFVAVNPEIIATAGKAVEREEGCLSGPALYAPVVRPERVLFRTQTLDGELIECECGGLLGRCIQHELDHLDGTLFTDRLSPEAERQAASRIARLKRDGARHNYLRTKS